MTSSRMMRVLSFVVWVMSTSSSVARAAEPCDELDAETKGTVPETPEGLRAAAQALNALIARCSAMAKQASTDRVPIVARILGASVRRQIDIANKMKAIKAAPEGAAPSSPLPKKRTPAAPAPNESSLPNRSATPATPATTRVNRNLPAAQPQAPKATESEQQARFAIDAAKQTWQGWRDALKQAQDEARRKLVTPFYVIAAANYLEAMVLWGELQSRDYTEILTPLIGDTNARAGLEIAVNGSRIRRLLEDPEKTKALERYIETSFKLGRSVPPERSAALKQAIDAKFSDETLEALTTAWGHQHAVALVNELTALADVGERIVSEHGSGKSMLVVTAGEGSCAKRFTDHLSEDLRTLYAERLQVVNVVEPVQTPAAFDAQLAHKLNESARTKSCNECDRALGVYVRRIDGNRLGVDGRLLFAGAKSPLALDEQRVVSCDDVESPVLIASAIFKALLEKVASRHRTASLFTHNAVEIQLECADSAENIRFGCGSFKRRLAPEVRTRPLAIRNGCSTETATALQLAIKQLGYPNALREARAGDPQLVLTHEGAAPPLPERCRASLSVGGEEYLHLWAQVLATNRPDEEALDRVRNAKTGDRLAMCLGSYYQATREATLARSEPIKLMPTPWIPALLAPGLPLVLDDNRGNDWAGYTWMGADALALASTIGFAFWSIDRRNAAAGDAKHDLSTANAYFTTSVISATIFAASHLTSLLVFGFRGR